MQEIILKVERCSGYLTGTSVWLKNQLETRNVIVKIENATSGQPAAFLQYDSERKEEGRKSTCLAVFGNWQYGAKIEQWPFPDSAEESEFFGAKLTPAATEIMKKLAKKAAETLHAEMQKEDAVNPKVSLPS